MSENATVKQEKRNIDLWHAELRSRGIDEKSSSKKNNGDSMTARA